MTAPRLFRRGTTLGTLVLVASATIVGLSCTAARDRATGGSGSNIYSPPGAVASALIESGDAKPLRTYGNDKHSWPEIRTSVGHTAHRGSDDVLCRDCHAREGFKHEGEGGCGREACHATEAKHPHGAVDKAKESGCTSCHSFHPGVPQKTCFECHKEGQTKKSSGAKLAAIVDGHSKAECGKCHQPHKEPLTKAADCTSCHEQRSTAHAKHAKSQGCSDCHATHAAASLAKTSCSKAGCHAKPEGAKPANHASCLTCHKGHAVDKPLACEGCHAKQLTLAATKVPQHGKCQSCHTAHSPLENKGACQKCHAKVTVGHAKPGAQGGTKGTPAIYASKGVTSVNQCGACHDAHPADPSHKAAACSTCHANISKTDQGAHASPLWCSGCHETHALKAPATKANLAALCAGCHTTQAKLTSANKGHADCKACHGGSTHQLAAPATCSSCHTAEQASASKGHQKCQTCHETHGGKLTSKAICTNCHDDRAKGPHATVQNSCQSCHRAHGPKGQPTPPSCQSCHEQPKLPGLHVKHTDCAKCHTAHSWANGTRASCTTAGCHTKMVKHEPTAKTCTGCHVFIKPGK